MTRLDHIIEEVTNILRSGDAKRASDLIESEWLKACHERIPHGKCWSEIDCSKCVKEIWEKEYKEDDKT